MEISIGGVPKEHLLARLAHAEIQFNDYAHSLFAHPAFSRDWELKNVALVKVKLADLGLSIPCSLQAIIQRAAALGLDPCDWPADNEFVFLR